MYARSDRRSEFKFLGDAFLDFLMASRPVAWAARALVGGGGTFGLLTVIWLVRSGPRVQPCNFKLPPPFSHNFCFDTRSVVTTALTDRYLFLFFSE